MKDREPRKIPFKAATILAGAVLLVGGGGFAREGWIDDSKARDQVQQMHPRPDLQLVKNAKATVAFIESKDSPAYTEVRSEAQSVINQDNAFNDALDDNKLKQRSDKEFYSGIAGLLGGMILEFGVAMQSTNRSNREWRKRLEAEESA